MSKYIYNLGQLFYKIVEQHASNIALKYPEGKSYTYTDLNKRSNQWANYLIQSNISKGDVIGILNDKSFEGFSLMLACIKIGAIYSNFDFTNPWERISKIISNCQPKLIFNDHENSDLIIQIEKHYSCKIVNRHAVDFLNQVNSLSNQNLPALSDQITGNDPLYIMFTSGSTGFPKGALMSHANVLNFIQWGQSTFNIHEKDVFTSANPIYFDNSVFDFYTALFSGASLVPFSVNIVKDAKQLVKAVNESECSIWFSVPSLLVYLLTTRSLKPTDFGSLRRIVFGGEGFSKPKLKQLYDLFGKRIQLYNVYGPTECTCICSSYLISEKDFENLNGLAPLGYMAPNFGYEILPLDKQNKNYGELGLTGPNVGLGYYNDEERTSKSFVQNPFKPFFQRMYKTGDLVEKREDNYIYFKGRIDNQIKHMGYRIELEEVESAINSCNYVNETGVVYKKINNDMGYIAAFISVKQPKTETEILSDLEEILPVYMLPKKIIVLQQLPKNRNGKIDRTQLAEIN